MKIAFHGAARTVTGSKHLLTLDDGTTYLLDCGMFQGMGRQTDDMNREWGFDPASIDFLILSHAHIDHSGLIPKLFKDGFKGVIFCTPPTKELTSILLEDSAQIQESDARYSNKKRRLDHLPDLQPMYTANDARQVMKLFVHVDYDTWFRINDSVELMYTDAGHIIGSAAVHLRITENKTSKQLSFSGDVGRYHDMILRPPQTFSQADYLILESTYGDKLHGTEGETPKTLLGWIKRTCLEKKGKLIIPAFSLGRTQELLIALNELEQQKILPALEYFVDSPMSIEVTETVKKFPKYFNDAIQHTLLTDKDPFAFEGLHYIKTAEESKTLNYLNRPCVIISASGMADSGRVKHHISNNVENSHNTILMVGYAEPRSLAGRLKNGEREVSIFGVTHEVHAEIGSMTSMSAHGDYEDLMRFVSNQQTSELKQIFLVHGEYDVQQKFRQRLLDAGFPGVDIPERHAEFELS